MKYNKGIAPIVIILAAVFVGGTVFAVVQRNVLKSYFQTGDKPTEAQFADTIDSSLNLVDDADRADSSTKPISPTPPPTPSVVAQKTYNPTKEYVIGDTTVTPESIYQAKVVSDVGTTFALSSDEPVTFRWTPAASSPEAHTTYRLRVWQLMQGQSGSEAMKTNQPIATKDVISTETTVSGIYTGPCKPPYLCDFVWGVEVIAPTNGNSNTSGGTTSTFSPSTATTDPTIATDDGSGGSSGSTR